MATPAALFLSDEQREALMQQTQELEQATAAINGRKRRAPAGASRSRRPAAAAASQDPEHEPEHEHENGHKKKKVLSKDTVDTSDDDEAPQPPAPEPAHQQQARKRRATGGTAAHARRARPAAEEDEDEDGAQAPVADEPTQPQPQGEEEELPAPEPAAAAATATHITDPAGLHPCAALLDMAADKLASYKLQPADVQAAVIAAVDTGLTGDPVADLEYTISSVPACAARLAATHPAAWGAAARESALALEDFASYVEFYPADTACPRARFFNALVRSAARTADVSPKKGWSDEQAALAADAAARNASDDIAWTDVDGVLKEELVSAAPAPAPADDTKRAKKFRFSVPAVAALVAHIAAPTASLNPPDHLFVAVATRFPAVVDALFKCLAAMSLAEVVALCPANVVELYLARAVAAKHVSPASAAAAVAALPDSPAARACALAVCVSAALLHPPRDTRLYLRRIAGAKPSKKTSPAAAAAAAAQAELDSIVASLNATPVHDHHHHPMTCEAALATLVFRVITAHDTTAARAVVTAWRREYPTLFDTASDFVLDLNTAKATGEIMKLVTNAPYDPAYAPLFSSAPAS